MKRIVSIAAAFFLCLIIVLYAYKLVIKSEQEDFGENSFITPSETTEPQHTESDIELAETTTVPAQDIFTEPYSETPIVTTLPPKTEDEKKVTFYIDPEAVVTTTEKEQKDPFVIDWQE